MKSGSGTQPLKLVTSTHQYCTFLLGRLLFGIRSEEIQEVVPYRELRTVPLAPLVVAGLVNLRGQLLVALDLRRQLELPERPVGMLPVGLVVRSAGESVCLLVDEVGSVIEVEDREFEPLPVLEALAPRLRRLLVGVHKLERQVLHVLDTEQVCAV
jgi:purine-binding chemotaxis protein CheW